MTATKLLQVYHYRDGEWERKDPNYGEYSFELWNGCHDDTVVMYGYEGNDDQRVTLEVSGNSIDVDAPLEEQIKNHTRFSAAKKWGYCYAVLYGNPSTPHDPHVAVLEIAEDAFLGQFVEVGEPDPSPHPYLVYVQLAFATHTVFVDSFPDLTRLLGEILPLVGNPPPVDVDIYGLHKWQATWGRIPIRRR